VGHDGTSDERVEPEPAVLNDSYAIYAATSPTTGRRPDRVDALDWSDYRRSACGLCSLDKQPPTVRSHHLHERQEEERSSILWPVS